MISLLLVMYSYYNLELLLNIMWINYDAGIVSYDNIMICQYPSFEVLKLQQPKSFPGFFSVQKS